MKHQYKMGAKVYYRIKSSITWEEATVVRINQKFHPLAKGDYYSGKQYTYSKYGIVLGDNPSSSGRKWAHDDMLKVRNET